MITIDEGSRNFFQSIFNKKIHKNFTIDDLIQFTDQLLAFIKAGFTLTSAIHNILQQTRSETLQFALITIHLEIEKGVSLSNSIEKYPELFPEYYVQNIRSAEVGGVFQETLSRLSNYLKGERQIKRQIKNLTLYPKIVLTLIIAGSLIVAVIQEIIPLTLYTLLGFVCIACLLFLIYDIFKAYTLKGKGREILDKIKLNIWVFSPVYINYLNKNFSEIFTSLFNAGLNLMDIFHLIGNSINNKIYGKELISIGDRIEEGNSLKYEINNCRYFSPSLKNLLLLGIHTGEFDKNLNSYIEYLESDIEFNIKKIFQITYIIILMFLIILVMIMKSVFL
ncbi:type II secretion system F family protein [candidate division KSB1 bacterium]